MEGLEDQDMIITNTANLIASGTVLCSRLLSRNGSVLVFPGQTVDPTTQIAVRKVWRSHFSVDLFGEFGISGRSNLRDYLLINEGDFVSVNEPIAQDANHTHHTLTARSSGRFLGVSSGSLIFEKDLDDLESVSAGVPGTVAEVVPNRGAFLETYGAYITGVWGNGKVGQGILLTLDDITKKGVLTAANLSMAMSGSVIFANSCYEKDVLQATGRLSPGGLIFGSLPSELLPVAEKLPFPVIVTDTIGFSRFSNPVLDILGDNIIKSAYIYSTKPQPGMGFRAEVIIPDDFQGDRTGPQGEIKIGSQVRILEGFFRGEVGYVTEIRPSYENEDAILEPHEDLVRVQVDSQSETVLPVANVEIIHF